MNERAYAVMVYEDLLLNIPTYKQRVKLLKKYIQELQDAQRARLRSVAIKYSYSKLALKELQRAQQQEILNLHHLTDPKDLPWDHRQHSSLTCVLLIKMHSSRRVAVTADPQTYTATTFTVPANVSITRVVATTHTYSYGAYVPEDTDVAESVACKFLDAIVPMLQKRVQKFKPLSPNYENLLKLVLRAWNSTAKKMKHVVLLGIYAFLKELSDETFEDTTLSDEVKKRVTEQAELIRVVGVMVEAQPQLILPHELCPAKTYSVTSQDLNEIDQCVGVTLVTPTFATELVGARDILATMAQMKANNQTLTDLLFTTVSYNPVTDKVRVATSLELIIRDLLKRTNFRNFIVVDLGCNVAPDSVPGDVDVPIGHLMAASGVAGGLR